MFNFLEKTVFNSSPQFGVYFAYTLSNNGQISLDT